MAASNPIFTRANSTLVDHIVFAHTGTTSMTTTNRYDYLNRLTGPLSSVASGGGGSVFNFRYAYNTASQRTKITLQDGSYWLYAYDSLGQLTNGVKYFRDGTPYAGQQFQYGFDTIGNRTSTEAGGDATGANLRLASYTNNALNQITSRSVPGYVDVMGLNLATNTVQVNGTNAYQKWEYYREQMATNNSSAAQWVGITVTAPGQTTMSGGAFVAQTPETFTYDYDGNETQDGRFTNIWDGENRLVNMTSLSGAPTASKYSLAMAYDYQSRRLQKIVSTNNGSAYGVLYTNRFLYDGWNVVGILDGGNNLLYSFTWGTDLNGSMQGAGGVGGLISMTVYSGSNAGTYFYCYDGNGNVTALVNASNGAVAANYEYGPFGEVIRATGPMAKVNPFLFSTKYYDWETGLYYYGFRYYNPSTGRWLSRDPIQEKGGKNLFAFVRNCPIGAYDPDGRITVRTLTPNPQPDYGGYDIRWNFILDSPAAQAGYIVQMVDFEWNYRGCQASMTPPLTRGFTYWEAWAVNAGQQSDNGHSGWGFTDNAYEPEHKGMHGTISQSGVIKFFYTTTCGDLDDPASGFGGSRGIGMSGDLPSTGFQPSWWNNPSDNGEGTASRAVTTSWQCCSGPGTIVVSP